MGIDYNEVSRKVNGLNQSAIKIVDMLAIIEVGKVQGENLTQTQIDGLRNRLKSEADNLKTLAGQVKTLVSE